MIKIGDIFYLDEEYSERAKFCNNNNLVIEEIESDAKGRRFQIVKKTLSQIDTYEDEIVKIKNWFDTIYTQKEQKFRRLRTLNLMCDNGADPYSELMSLYQDAEIKRKRIQEIEKILENEKIKGENIDA